MAILLNRVELFWQGHIMTTFVLIYLDFGIVIQMSPEWSNLFSFGRGFYEEHLR